MKDIMQKQGIRIRLFCDTKPLNYPLSGSRMPLHGIQMYLNRLYYISESKNGLQGVFTHITHSKARQVIVGIYDSTMKSKTDTIQFGKGFFMMGKCRIMIVIFLILFCSGHALAQKHLIKSYKETSLHDAVRRNDKNEVLRLIKKGANINALDSMGFTPLHEAAMKGRVEIAKILISKGAKVNSRTGIYRLSPLYQAALMRRYEIIRLLAKNGANMNIRDSQGSTPLMTSVENGSTKTALLLISLGAKVNLATKGGTTPLDLAVSRSHKETVKALISKSANVNANVKGSGTALHIAAFDGNVEMAKILIASGANVNAKNKRGETPLDSARMNPRTKMQMMMFLRKHGAKRGKK